MQSTIYVYTYKVMQISENKKWPYIYVIEHNPPICKRYANLFGYLGDL